MIDLRQETDALASWPTAERIRALQRIIPRARVEEVLAQIGHDRAVCRRLPGWFMVGFLIALGLCGRDGYRRRFRWLQPFRPGAIPGRSTWCEARQRLGIAPLRVLAERVVRRLGQPGTPGAFYRGMRTMALDGFVLDVADTPANERAFGRPGSGRAPGAFPPVRLSALCETGSHVLWRWLLKPPRRGEDGALPVAVSGGGQAAPVGSQLPEPRDAVGRAAAPGAPGGPDQARTGFSRRFRPCPMALIGPSSTVPAPIGTATATGSRSGSSSTPSTIPAAPAKASGIGC